MTKPEIFRESQESQERCRWLGQRALQCIEQGQKTLDESKELLMEISRVQAGERKLVT